VAFVGNSGSGKTTLLEKLIPLLAGSGLRVGALKHDAHRFEIDHPGKDSWRLARAGAQVTAISSPDKSAVIVRHDASPPLEDLLPAWFAGMDIVLVEGYRTSALPKIEVHRRAVGGGLLCRGARRDPHLAAVASDEPLAVDVPVFHLDDAQGIARFVAGLEKERSRRRRSTRG